MIHTAWIFDLAWKDNNYLIHDFGKLITRAGLDNELNRNLASSPVFVANWATVTQWKRESRYQPKTEAEAIALYAAITDNPDGVLK